MWFAASVVRKMAFVMKVFVIRCVETCTYYEGVGYITCYVETYEKDFNVY